MFKLKNVLMGSAAASALLVSSPVVEAADLMDPVPSPSNQFYVSIFGGIAHNHEFDSETRYIGGTGGYGNDIDLDNGFILGAAVGMDLMPSLRGEVEFAYQHFDAGDINYNTPGNPASKYDGEGSIESYTILANLWYDLDQVSVNGITPYIGGGIGFGSVNSNIQYEEFPTFDFEGEDHDFAYQLGAGVNWAVSSNMSVELGYRYKVITGVDLDGNDPGFPARHDFGDWSTHAVIVGVNWRM